MALSDGYHALPPGKVASVVTYVEMKARPGWIDGPWPGALEAFPVGDRDAYRAFFRRIGEPWLWFSRLRLSDEDLARRLEKPGYAVWSYSGGRGIVELDASLPGETEIVLFGLAPGETGRGTGKAMMAHALQAAWGSETRRVWLHTCTLDDPRALGFYRHMGFTAYARGVEIATDPRVAGYLPETAAPQVPLIG